jgi:hypothetical protein
MQQNDLFIVTALHPRLFDRRRVVL